MQRIYCSNMASLFLIVYLYGNKNIEYNKSNNFESITNESGENLRSIYILCSSASNNVVVYES